MRVGHLLTAFSPERLRERGLIGLSGFMAAACALTALLSTLVVLLAFVGAFVVPALSLPDGRWSAGPANLTVDRRSNPPFSQKTVCTFTPNGRSEGCKTTVEPAPSGPVRPDRVGELISVLSNLAFLTPLAALTFGLFQASGCFVDLARKRYFERRTVRRLANFAVCGLVFMVVFPNVAPISAALGDLVDAVVNGLGPKGRWVHHSPNTFQLTGAATWLATLLPIISAAALAVIATVMAKAAALADDHAQIV